MTVPLIFPWQPPSLAPRANTSNPRTRYSLKLLKDIYVTLLLLLWPWATVPNIHFEMEAQTTSPPFLE